MQLNSHCWSWVCSCLVSAGVLTGDTTQPCCGGGWRWSPEGESPCAPLVPSPRLQDGGWEGEGREKKKAVNQSHNITEWDFKEVSVSLLPRCQNGRGGEKTRPNPWRSRLSVMCLCHTGQTRSSLLAGLQSLRNILCDILWSQNVWSGQTWLRKSVTFVAEVSLKADFNQGLRCESPSCG